MEKESGKKILPTCHQCSLFMKCIQSGSSVIFHALVSHCHITVWINKPTRLLHCTQSIIEQYKTIGWGWLLAVCFNNKKNTSLVFSRLTAFFLLLCLPSSTYTVFDKFGVTQIVTEAHHYAPVSCCLTFEFRSRRYK